MKDNKDAAVRKRQQITKANKTMFIVVAIASAITGIAVVLIVFLIQEMSFNAKVIGVQDKSISILKSNITNVEELEDKMKNLQTNTELLSSRANSEDNALRVILDALPSSENTAALGSSISNKLLNVPGIKIETINMDSSDAVIDPSADPAAETSASGVGETPTPIDFSFSVSSNDPNNILQVTRNLERSIRTIKVVSFKVEQSKDAITLTVQAQAFYLPQAKIELKDEVVKSKETAGSTSSGTSAGTSGGAK